MPVTSLEYAIADGNGADPAASQSAIFDLLCACCAHDPHSQPSARILTLLHDLRDWAAFFDHAERQDVLPLAYRALSRFSTSVPSSVLEPLRHTYQCNSRKSLWLTQELIRILGCLESHGIPAIPYKGPILAACAYGDLTLRQFSDLDILIPAAHLPAAKAAVKELGYAPSRRMTAAEQRACLASGYEMAFDGPGGNNLLEIQWRILPRFYAVDFRMEDLFDRAVYVPVGGMQVRSLAAEDQLLVICVHAAKHAWARLSYLCDVAAILHPRNHIDFEVVRERAEDLGILRILGVSLWLVHELLGVPSPVPLEDLGRNNEIALLGRQVKNIITAEEEYDTVSPAYFRLMLRLRERRRDKLRLLSRLAFTSGIGEWKITRLPTPLFPIYRVIRLFRLAGRLSMPAHRR